MADKQFIGTDDNWIYVPGLLGAELGMSYPKVATLTTPEDTSKAWMVEQGGKLWRWKTTTLEWIEVGTSATVAFPDITGDPLANPALQPILDGKEDVITESTSADYIGGDKATYNFELKVYEFGDVRYLKLDDVEAAVLAIAEPKFDVDQPLEMYTDGSDVVHLRARFDEATWNANKLMGVEIKPGTPNDGDILTYNAGMNYAEWKAPL